MYFSVLQFELPSGLPLVAAQGDAAFKIMPLVAKTPTYCLFSMRCMIIAIIAVVLIGRVAVT